MIELPPFKAGDAYIETCHLCAADGVTGIPLTNYTVASSVMTADGQLWALTVTINPDQTNNPGVFDLLSTTTQDWATGMAQRDIKYTLNGLPEHTETDQFPVEQAITP